MRLHAITVRHFRGIVEQRLEPLPTGVTVVAGPNEVGKTSLGEAVDLLFERLDSSQATAIRDAQPLGRDVGPEVEVEAEAGPYRFRYRKRFVRQPETELEVAAPRGENFTGREAHDRVEALLDETGVDLDLWRALRVVQGVGVGQPSDLANSPPLLAALDRAAAGAGRGQHRSAALFERAREEYLRYFTDKRGDPRAGGPLQEAREELAAAQQAEERLAAEMHALEEDARRAEELERQRGELRAEERQAVAVHREAADERERVERLEEEVRTCRARLVEEESTRELLQELSAAGEAERALAGRLESARADARRAEADLAPAEAALAAAEGDRQRSERELETARRRQRLAEQLAAHRGTVAELEERIERAARAARRVADGEAVLEALPAVDDDALSQLEELHRETEQVEAALAAASPRVEVEALDDLALTVSAEDDDEVVELTAGDEWEQTPSGPLHLTMPGVARLTVTPGGDVAALASRRRALTMERASRLEVLGVDDLEAARAAHRDRRRAENTLESARAALREVTAEGEADALEERRDRADATAQRLAAELLEVAGESGKPPAPEEAERAVSAASTAARETLDREKTARRAVEEKRSALESARSTARVLEAEHRSARERRQRAWRRLSEVESLRADAGPGASDQLGLFQTPTEAGGSGNETEDTDQSEGAEKKGGEWEGGRLAGVLEAVERRVTAAREELAAARRQLADEEPETVHRRAEEAAARHRRLAEELRRTEDEHLKVTTRLESAGEQGLFQDLQAARARLAAAERRAAGAEARAAAARRLYEALSSARSAARVAYAEPLRRKIEELGRPLFGDDFAVELGDDLTIVRRTAFGRTLEVERLSTGAREQLSLLLRLACALLVSPREGVPLILDDALGYSDPQRLAAMGRILSLAGERCQVLVFTSFPERYRHVEGAREVILEGAPTGGAVVETSGEASREGDA